MCYAVCTVRNKKNLTIYLKSRIKMNENKKLKNLLRSVVKRNAPQIKPPAPEDILAMLKSRQQDVGDEIDVTTFLQNLSKKK